MGADEEVLRTVWDCRRGWEVLPLLDGVVEHNVAVKVVELGFGRLRGVSYFTKYIC